MMAVKYKLHHFFNYEPDNALSISGLAVNDEQKKLAVLRKSIVKNLDEFPSTTIEIWNYGFNNSFFVEQRIFDDYKKPQLAESIDWGKDGRLFTVGLNEKLNEINLDRGCIKKSYQIISGPAYCMRFNKSKELVAIGTDHGYICVFNICENSKNEVNIVKNLKITSKVFSLDWYERSNEQPLLIASTTEQIRIFNYKTGVQTDVIYIDTIDCHIWSIRVLPNQDDFVIISGDSTGCVVFHDGSTCTQIASFNLHTNDVNAICCKNDKRAFSLGLDGRLCKFSYLNGRVIVQGNQQYISDYELKSIASSEVANSLFIGGSDSELKRADPASQSLNRFQQDFERCINTYDRYLMYQHEKCLKLWKLGDPNSDETNDNYPIYLGAILSKKEIIASAINRKFIVFSDFHKTTVLSRKNDRFKRLGIIANSELGYNLQNLSLLKNTLYIQTTKSVHQFDLTNFKSQSNLEVNRIKFKRRIFKTSISSNYVTIIFDENLIEFYDLNLKENVASLETKTLPLIVEWQSDSIVWFLTNSNLYIIYDLVNKKILRSDELKQLLGLDINWKTKVEGLTFTEHSTIIYTRTKIYSINNETGQMNANSKYGHILKLGKINDNEFYLIELPFDNTVKHIPIKVHRKKYGVN